MPGEGKGRSRAERARKTRIVSTLASLRGLVIWVGWWAWWERAELYRGGLSSALVNWSSDSVPRISRLLLLCPEAAELVVVTWFRWLEDIETLLNGSSEADLDLLPKTGSMSSLLCLLEFARLLGTVRTLQRRVLWSPVPAASGGRILLLLFRE